MRKKSLICSLFALLGVFAPIGESLAAPGDLDPTFGTNGVVIARFGEGDRSSDMALQADGKILVTGVTESVVDNIGIRRWYFARFLSNGSPDVSFGADGVQVMDCQIQFCFGGGRSIALQQDGRIVVLGHEEFGQPVTRVVRLLPDGAFDPTFGSNGVVSIQSPNAGGFGLTGTDIAVDATGALVFSGVVGGNSQTGFVGRLLGNGSPDPTFGTNGIVQVSVPEFTDTFPLAIKIAQDRKILVAGAASAISQNTIFLTRLNATGGVDQSFGTGGFALILRGPSNAQANDLELGPDGKIVVCGIQGSGGIPTRIAIARLTADGVLDRSFGSDGLSFPVPNGDDGRSLAYGLTVEPDGGIVVVGTLIASKVLVLRLLPDGSKDTRFGGDGQVDFSFTTSSSVAGAIQVQGDGKYLIGGNTFDRPDGDPSIGIARLQGTPPLPPPTPPVPIPVDGLLASIILAMGMIVIAQQLRRNSVKSMREG